MPINVELTEKKIGDGKATLKQLRIDGRETAIGFGEYVDMTTPIIASQHPAATIKNLRSEVFHSNDGGWFVLFFLKNVPKGLPEVFSAPSQRPCKSYEEAYNKACIESSRFLGK